MSPPVCICVLLIVLFDWINATVKVWVDTDIGTDVDDTLAILELLSIYPDIVIVGCSTVATNPKLAAMILQKYLSYFGFSNIPIYIGLNETVTQNFLYYNPYIDENIIDTSQYSYWQSYLKPFPPPVDLFNSVDIVYGIAPLTNIAYLFSLESDEYRIKKLIQMGGAPLDQREEWLNVSNGVIWDYNLRVDPVASWNVLSSEKLESITFITGNLTLICWMTQQDLQSMKAVRSRYSAYPLIINEIEAWNELLVAASKKGAFKVIFEYLDLNITVDDIVEFMHDPLTVSYGFSDDIQSWLTMDEMEIVFWINDNNILETIPQENFGDTTGYDTFTRTVTVSVDNDCDMYLDWYFNSVNNFRFPDFSAPIICTDVNESGGHMSNVLIVMVLSFIVWLTL